LTASNIFVNGSPNRANIVSYRYDVQMTSTRPITTTKAIISAVHSLACLAHCSLSW